MFKLRGLWHRALGHRTCPCCNRRFKGHTGSPTRWYTLGGGFSTCDRHPDNSPWPHRRWERWDDGSRGLVLSLPMTYWTQEERNSWKINCIQDALILGISCTQQEITHGLELDRHNGRAIYVGTPAHPRY